MTFGRTWLKAPFFVPICGSYVCGETVVLETHTVGIARVEALGSDRTRVISGMLKC
jgi:hypothetical protein